MMLLGLGWLGAVTPAPAQERTTLTGHKSSISGLALSRDGKILASSSHDNTIKLWDLTTGRELRTLEGHYGYGNGVAFSPDGKVLAAGSRSGDVTLYATDTWKEKVVLKGSPGGVMALAFSHDGKSLAVAGWEKKGEKWSGVFHL